MFGSLLEYYQFPTNVNSWFSVSSPEPRGVRSSHTGAQVGELVVELPLAVGGIEGKQDPGELAEIFRGDRALYDS